LFDTATPKGWVSLYGVLNGGTYFNTDLIGHPGQSAHVSWDFSTLPGYSMSRMLLEGRAADGTAWVNLYSVPGSFREFDALETVLIHDGVDICRSRFLDAGRVALCQRRGQQLPYSQWLSAR
jgi:hypothetical protein